MTKGEFVRSVAILRRAIGAGFYRLDGSGHVHAVPPDMARLVAGLPLMEAGHRRFAVKDYGIWWSYRSGDLLTVARAGYIMEKAKIARSKGVWVWEGREKTHLKPPVVLSGKGKSLMLTCAGRKLEGMLYGSEWALTEYHLKNH